MKSKKGMIASFSMFIIIGLIGGCSSQADEIDENMLGIQQLSQDKQIVTITCNTDLNHFAAAVEEQFSDIQLVQDSYMGQYRNGEHIARIEHHDFGDIIMVKSGHIPKVDMSRQLFDLSTQAFPANFNVNTLQTDEDGHISLIPGPLSFNCNIYNKTLFEENGWTVPDNYDDFLALCEKIDKTGIRGCRNVYFDSGSQSYQIYNYCLISALDTLTQVEGQNWHNKLMAGETVPLDPMENTFQTMQNMMEAGLIRVEDLEFSDAMRMKALLDRKVAISGGEVDRVQKLNDEGTDQFGFMPHFSMTDGQGWLLNQGYYFGVNEKLRQPEHEKKMEAVMKVMNFIASEEGQKILIEDHIGMIAATRGAEIPDDPILEHIRTQIESGHYIIRPGYDMFASVLGTEIAAFIRRETDSQSVLDKCRIILEQGAQPPQALGEATEDFTVVQTGCLKADSMRASTGTDIALVGMSEVNCYDPVGGTRSKFYKGSVTEDDITRIAQIKTDAPVMCNRSSVTGAELVLLLEYGATSVKEQEIGSVSHYHPFAVSGLELSYHLDEEEGKRVADVKLSDGRKFDASASYTVSYLEGAFPEAELKGTETGITMTDALRNYIIEKEKITPDTKRIRFK